MRKFGSLPTPKNYTSKHKTPATVIYDMHWDNLQLVSRWNWERFARFSAFLKHTPYELGSMVMLKHDAVDSLKRFDQLTGREAGPIALILTLMESHLLANWKDDLIENPFPSIQSPA